MNPGAPESCPVCAAPARALYASVDGWPIDRCDACGHRFCRGRFGAAHTAAQYDDDYFTAGGHGYPDYLAEADRRRADARHYGRRIAALRTARGLPATGAALDVGCAAGFLMEGLADTGWRVSGIEPNAGMIAHARARGLDAHVGRLEDLDAIAALQKPAGGYDLIMMVQVIGHLTDVQSAIAHAAARLAPQGMLLVETWDSDSRVARLFGSQWQEYCPPNVLHYFTRTSLDRLMQRHGLARLAAGRAPKRLGAAHLRSFVVHRYRSGAGRAVARVLGLLPDGLSLPYPGDDLFHAVFTPAREQR